MAGQEWNTGTWGVGFTILSGWDQAFNSLKDTKPQKEGKMRI
jgi:hypothetical protein